MNFFELKRDLIYYNKPATVEIILDLIKIIEEKDYEIEEIHSETDKSYQTGFRDGRDETIEKMNKTLQEKNL